MHNVRLYTHLHRCGLRPLWRGVEAVSGTCEAVRSLREAARPALRCVARTGRECSGEPLHVGHVTGF